MFPIVDVSDDSSDEIITLDIEEGAAIVDDNESHDIEEGNGGAAGEEAEETNEGGASGGGELEPLNIQDWSSAANE